MKNCEVCGRMPSFYLDRQTGQHLCAAHARLAVVAVQEEARDAVVARPALDRELDSVVALADSFWEETEVDAFGRSYDLGDLPAYVVENGGVVVGAVSYSLEGVEIHLVAMQVLPGFQGQGAGRALVEAVLDEGRQAGAKRAVLVTTNDNLLALCLYQRMGFVITEVIPGAVVGYHGGEEVGFAGIPVRDEIRMALDLGSVPTDEE